MKTTKAILLVSFGCSYLDSKEKTIDRIAAKAKAHFPDHKIYQAWTSKVIIKILKKRERLVIPTIEEAMAAIAADGIESLVVQPTHLINGLENDVMTETVRNHAPENLKLRFGAPLLTSTKDQKAALSAVIQEFSSLSSKEALVLMGHGTAHEANSVYASLDNMLKDMGYPNFFMGTVEACPDLEDLIRQISLTDIKKVHLAPFMLVAGEHANKDMAGEQENSWKSLFTSAGYEVVCHLKGLGEYESIQEIYMEHLRQVTDSADD